MEVILKVGSRVSVLKLGRGMPQIYLRPGSIKDRRTSQSEPGKWGGGERDGRNYQSRFLPRRRNSPKRMLHSFTSFFGKYLSQTAILLCAISHFIEICNT